MLGRQAERYRGKTLFVAQGQSWSFADTATEAADYAGRLMQADIGRGDRVALMCGNRAEFLGLFLGCGWLGAVSVPINTASRGQQLQHILRNSGARLLAIEASCLEALAAIDLSETDLTRIWLIDGEPPDLPVPCEPLPGSGTTAPPADLGPGDLLTILYTSGTTGLPKGVCCPHAQYFAWALTVGCQLALTENDVLHTTLPLFHTNALGTFFQALLHGVTLVVEPRFSVSRFWERLVEHRATVTYVLGAMVPMLLSRTPEPIERAHGVRVALAPGVPVRLQDEFSARCGIGLIDGYGATESNAVIGCDLTTRRDGFMGHLQLGFEARVVDENDQELADGEAGELLLRAAEPFAFAAGYFAMPEKTVAAWRNLWLHTGDRVVREDGYFRFVDRMTDAIRRRGENISSYEVEQVLLSHPAVEIAAVYAVPSELAEDEVMASLVLKPEVTVGASEIAQFCRGRISNFAIPRYIAMVDAVPRTESGKIKKYELRARGVTAGCWDRMTNQ